MNTSTSGHPMMSRVLMPTLLIALAAADVALLRHNRQLKASAAASAAQSVTIRAVSAGQTVPPVLSGVDARDGGYTTVDLRAGQKRTLLIYVSRRCPACRESMEVLRQAASAAEASGRWHVVWLSTDPLPDTQGYFSQEKISSGIVLADVPWRIYRRLGMNGVPMTVMIGSDGVVTDVWDGRVTDADLPDMKRSIAGEA